MRPISRLTACQLAGSKLWRLLWKSHLWHQHCALCRRPTFAARWVRLQLLLLPFLWVQEFIWLTAGSDACRVCGLQVHMWWSSPPSARSTVRLFELTEEFDACKSSWTKTADKVKKSVFLRYEVSRFLVSIQTWCVVLINTFKITSL